MKIGNEFDMKREDVVVCLPGFNNSDSDREELLKGGTGYKEGLIVKINRVDAIIDGEIAPIIWTYCGEGIWGQAVRPATEFEKQAFEKGITSIKHINYEPEYY